MLEFFWCMFENILYIMIWFICVRVNQSLITNRLLEGQNVAFVMYLWVLIYATLPSSGHFFVIVLI